MNLLSILGGKQTTVQPVITVKPVITYQTIIEIIDDVCMDPLAGRGGISEKHLLADRLFALWQTADGRPVQDTPPLPRLFGDRVVLDRPATDNEAAQVAKVKTRKARLRTQPEQAALPEPLLLNNAAE
jgi:hypothetical protein